MDATPRWSLPLLFAGQAQKEVMHNEALTMIDALLHGQVESATIGAPPADPVPGQCWIVAAPGEGVWSEEEGNIACWTEGGWRFMAARAGLAVVVADEAQMLVHDGSQWRAGSIRADGLYLNDQKVVGVRQPAISAPTGGTAIDAQARSSINAILETLRAHGLIVA